MPTDHSNSSHSSMSGCDDTSASEEWQMLDDPTDFDSGKPYAEEIAGHDLDTTPLLTRDAFEKISDTLDYATQYGLLGRIISVQSKGIAETTNDSRLYLNTNAPFSAIVCGVQGSGKSHTVSTILESMLIPGFSAVGTLVKPLCGLVLHYGESGASALPSEAAWISQPVSSYIQSPPVVVYVSPSSLKTMQTVYSKLGSDIEVKPLYFQRSELDAAAFLSMMAISSTESAPLYMQIILSILRRLGENFSYETFVLELEKCKKDFNPAQIAGVQQRMSLLTSFLDPMSPSKRRHIIPSRFAKGQLTIIDLSDPFLDSSSACGLFEIVVRLFLRADVGTGKVLVVDEAHKYLSANKSASGLTNALLAVIRQQRHLAMRVIISTQEPTVVPPVLLDLCTVAILHRFSSPSWWNHLVNHVSADFTESDAFDKVVKLQTGQAIILAASALGIFVPINNTDENKPQNISLTHFGRRYLVMKTRRRITADGGKSVLVLDN
ncbi:hypothetical protein BDQ17DRAFT_1301128 [Cyathus striatus]|nr:hypothetical protein BDQ17DRAFT_1301128 [Cyathus striatus]